MFVDELTLSVQAGDGGNGVVAFLREKYRPWGGPAGGDGGKGGDVVFEATREADTLFHLYRKKLYKAQSGRAGQGKNCSGKEGRDTVIRVPMGTIVKDAKSGEDLCDLTQEGQRFIVAHGGRGGRGNQHFATSTHQTPHECEPGKKGEERRVKLELKLIADVGLVGLPNAGKSTLLSRISAAHPKIAPYPFTTRHPELGIVEAGNYRQFVVADIPGLIEGAHAGAGLGDEFLRHIERTSFLVHVVDVCPLDESDPLENFRVVEKELAAYSPALASRGRLVAANKTDLTDGPERAVKLAEALKAEGIEVVAMSAATGAGVKALIEKLLAILGEMKTARAPW